MQKATNDEVRAVLAGKRVAVVGSGPGCLDNEPGFVDSHDIVVRVNNHRIGENQGFRTDVFYSFFGSSIHKTPEELKAEGVKLCICKCPDAKFMDSPWHNQRRKQHGTDFAYIYRLRADFWFCPTYVPTVAEFVEVFDMLEQHIPSTGFSALVKVAQCEPALVYLTGFDFFASRTHNVNEPWRPGNPDDPIGHAPELERAWLRRNRELFSMDPRLTKIMETD